MLWRARQEKLGRRLVKIELVSNKTADEFINLHLSSGAYLSARFIFGVQSSLTLNEQTRSDKILVSS
jgi:hypothetical protein